MDRRSFLASTVAAASASVLPVSAAEDDDIVVRSRDRLVEHETSNGYSRWTIRNRHTGDEVYGISVPKSIVRHSYASEYHVFIAVDVGPKKRKTIEWFLQSDDGRTRTVHRNGSTEIIEYDANERVVRRR